MSPYTPGSVSPSLSLQRLKLKYDYLFSSFAFNYNLRPCGEVPSFDNKLAFDTLEEQLGGKWDEFYTELGPEPVAAASLGQVYKGVLRSTGDIVAVKVQRPAVLETVSIDLYIIRNLGIALRSVPQIATDVVAGAFTRPLLGSTLALCMG